MSNTKIHIGQSLGDWTVIEALPYLEGKHSVYRRLKVRHKCGFERPVFATHLKPTLVCEQCRKQNEFNGIEVHIGSVFGRWTVLNEPYLRGERAKRMHVLCKCECGHEKELSVYDLTHTKRRQCNKCLNADRVIERKQLGHGGIIKSYWSSVLKRADGRKKKNGTGRVHEFTITIEYAWELFLKQNGKCALTGQNIKLPKSYYHFRDGDWDASLDKIDNNKGYIPGNVQWLHKDVNMLKNTFPQSRFLELCTMVFQHQFEHQRNLPELKPMIAYAVK